MQFSRLPLRPLAFLFYLFAAGLSLGQTVDVRTGIFLPFRQLSLKNPYVVKIADLNSDGRADLIVASQASDPPAPPDYKIQIYYQTADGNLTQPVVYSVAASSNLLVADVNSDGRADLIITTSQGFGVFYQNTDGTLAPIVSYPSTSPGLRGSYLAAGDFNHDGRTDVAAVMTDYTLPWVLEIFSQSADGSLVSTSRLSGGLGELIAGDLNSDGLDDLLTWGIAGYNLRFQLPDGGFTAIEEHRSDSSTTLGAAVADVNHDARNDLILLRDESFFESSHGGWQLEVMAQDANRHLSADPAYYRAYSGSEDIAIADANNDGRPDLLTYSGDNLGLSVYLQKPDGTLTDREIYPAPESGSTDTYHSFLATGDLNGDGQIDAAVLTKFGVWIYYHAPIAERISNVASFDSLSLTVRVENPLRELIFDQNGNFYGVGTKGGRDGSGVIFRATKDGAIASPTEFSYETGRDPVGGLALADDGNLYGTTTHGAFSNSSGTIFRLSPTGTLQTMVQFNGTNGANPAASLTKGRDGAVYGTTMAGGSSNNGVIFKLTTAGAFTVLYSFDGTTGREPWGKLLQASDGYLYGTTRHGGVSDFRAVFRISTTGAFTMLASLDGTNGSYPLAGLAEANGSFFGTATAGGDDGLGTVFKVSSGTLSRILSFLRSPASFPKVACFWQVMATCMAQLKAAAPAATELFSN